ncbi:MAG: DinB family protein [Acidobacteriales bacterium]|nr:DinB family protein [Terriglobales bacterium]
MHLKRALPIAVIAALSLMAANAQQPKPIPTPQVSITRNFHGIHAKIIEMAQDFPADKYDFKPNKDVRSFREVLVHIAGGLQFAAKAGSSDQKVNWDELDPNQYKTKEDVVAMLQKLDGEAEAALKAWPEEKFSKQIYPWMAVIEHSAEHYGQLVVYYRLNNLVPPETRKGNN